MSKRPSKKAVDALNALYKPLDIQKDFLENDVDRYAHGRVFKNHTPRNIELEAQLSRLGIPRIT